MKRIRWSPAAFADLSNIRDYLHEHYPPFERTTIRRIYAAARSLRKMPYRGRHIPSADVRELVLTPLPYIIVYSVEDGLVHVLRIFHAAQDR